MQKSLFKLFVPTLLAIECLISCGSNPNSNVSHKEKYYLVNQVTGSVNLYDGVGDNISFDSEVCTRSVYRRKSEYNNNKIEIHTIEHIYYKANGGLIFSSSVKWYDLYYFETEEELNASIYHEISFKVPNKPQNMNYAWGEYGKGWIKEYGSFDGYSNNLYVTKFYAKRVGVDIREYKYNETKKEYDLT